MNKKNQYLLNGILISIGISILALIINYLSHGELTPIIVLHTTLITLSYSIPLYFVNAFSFHYLKIYGKNRGLKYWKSFAYGFPFVIIANYICIKIIQFILSNYFLNDAVKFGDIVLNEVKIPLWISLNIGIFYFVYYLIIDYQKQKSERRKQEISQMKQTHEALKSNIGAHFLFNSLNVLSGLVDENPMKAQEFIEDLAQVYRYVLDREDKDWVPLSEEISFAKTYLDLIQTRFEKSLNVEIERGLEHSNLLIAPLSLQLLLENCIKHNALSANDVLNIKIYTENSFLVVQNNLNPKRVFSERKGMGLENIKNRYAQLSLKIKIIKTEYLFKVAIPLLTQNKIKMQTSHQFTEEEMRIAREMVRERRGFYGNLISYFVICSILVIFNLIIGGYFWAVWPMLGWGIGVIFHGLGVFVFGNKLNEAGSWEDIQARKLLEKRKKSRDNS